MDATAPGPADVSADAYAGGGAAAPEFLDVPSLLEQSQPKPRANPVWYILGGVLLLAMVSTYLKRQQPQIGGVLELVSAVLMMGIMAGMAAMTYVMATRQRAEVKQVEAIEEMVQLRRWPQAAAALQRLLSSPTRTPAARVQGLIYLTSVLARYHRFEDAIAVQNHLLENVRMDPATEYAVRLARAMAMLREDHLVDADRAFGELRRMAGGEDAAAPRDSAGLALLEIYRDVKTGHPAEAIEIFDQRLPALRDQLGHRVADAYALAAKAYDQLGREAEARSAYERATLLSPPSELHRRYPEIESLSTQYRAAAPPAA